MSRGGARVRTGAQCNNSTGLLGITFVWEPRENGGAQPLIRIAVGERRYTRGILRVGRLKAMQAALKLRSDAGLPVDTIGRALRALRTWEMETRP